MSEYPDFPDTFEVLDIGGKAAIKCLHCGLVSYNPNDVAQKFCGKCGLFHEDIWPPARKWWINDRFKSR